MKILITVYKPLRSVELIQIFEPRKTDEHTISFLVNADGVYATFMLKDNGKWRRKGSNGKYTRKTIDIIEQSIIYYYFSIKNKY